MGSKGSCRLEFHSGAPILKVLVVLLIILSSVALVALGWFGKGLLQEVQFMKEAAAALEQDNRDLQEKIDNLGSIQSDQDIAREELGLVDPNTVFIQPK